MSGERVAMAAGWRLAIIAGVVAAAVMAVARFASPYVARNERAAFIASLAELTGMPLTDHDVPATLPDRFALCFTDGEVMIRRVVALGYGGNIQLIIARDATRLRGVRVTGHRETPGIGDIIDRDRSQWIDGFTGLPVNGAPLPVDIVTGATITTRAVVAAVTKAISEPMPNAGACTR
jgi:electron transport complex protein RnfG